MAGSKAGSRTQKVVIPHPAKAQVIFGDLIPLLIYIRMPGHQGLVVIGAEIMDIFDDHLLLNRLRDLSQRGQNATGKNVAIEEWIGNLFGLIRGDGVMKHRAIWF